MDSGHHYPKGHIFFEEGDEGDSAYILKSGQVEIFTQQGNKEIVIAVFDRGALFGEMALLGAKTRTAGARVTERVEVIKVSRARLFDLLREEYPILKHIILRLITRLQETTVGVKAEKSDDFGVGICRLLALMANQKSNPTDQSQSSLLPYAQTIEQIREILSVDAADCQAILEQLEAVSLIETIPQKSSQGKLIRLVDEEHFLQKAERVLKELEVAFLNHLIQSSIYIDLYDLSEQIGVQREQICTKIGEGEVPVELIFLKKDDILKWANEVGPSFFEPKKTRISSSEELYSLDGIVLVKNAIVRTALRQMDFHQTCLLLKTASEPARDKIMVNLPGRSKSIIEQELSLIESVDADDVQAATEDFLDEIRDLMEAEETRKSSGE